MSEKTVRLEPFRARPGGSTLQELAHELYEFGFWAKVGDIEGEGGAWLDVRLPDDDVSASQAIALIVMGYRHLLLQPVYFSAEEGNRMVTFQ